jgi:hypothetical protein
MLVLFRAARSFADTGPSTSLGPTFTDEETDRPPFTGALDREDAGPFGSPGIDTESISSLNYVEYESYLSLR